MEDIKKDFAEYLKLNIRKPSNWEFLGLGEFPPGFTSTKRYCEHIVTNEPDSMKTQHIYNFFDFTEGNESFVDWISSSNKTKAIENFFKKENYVPVNKTLEFIGALFDAPISSLGEYQNSLQNNLLKKEEELATETETIQINNNESKKSFQPLSIRR